MTPYTPDEIREIYDEYQRHRALNLPITKELADRMRDATAGIKHYTQQVDSSFAQLKASGVGLFNSFKDGQQGASVFNDSLRSGADLLAMFLKALGPLGWVLGTMVKASAEYVAAANEQSDALFDGYNLLTKFGAGLDNGVDGVYRVSQQLGYSTKELERFAGLLYKDRAVFPILGGTATQGVKDFGNLVDSLRIFEVEFRTLGLTIDDVNQSLLGFTRIQSLTGRAQTQNLMQLSSAAYQYIQQQVLVSRLTGQTAEQQLTAEQQMLDNTVFQVAMREMEQQRQAALQRGDDAEYQRLTQQIEENRKLILMLPPDLQKGFMDNMLGYRSASEDAQQLFRIMPTAIQMMLSQRHSAVEILQKASEEARDKVDRFGPTQAALGHFDDFFRSYAAVRQLDLMTSKMTIEEREAAVRAQMDALKNIQGATKDYAVMLVEQRRTREAAEDVINIGINAATRGAALLTSAANSAANVLSKTVGAAPTAPRAPRAARPTTAPAAGTAPPSGATGTIQHLVQQQLLAQGIRDPRAVANIMAQIQAESNFVPRSENLNYSGSKLFELFGVGNRHGNRVRFRTMAQAEQVAALGPEVVGNMIYGGRMGNAATEGFKYRGRGLIQLTGKDNYKKYGKIVGVDLVSNPDRANDRDIAIKIAAAYFAQQKRLGVDLTDITAVGQAVGYATGPQETQRRAQIAQQFIDTEFASLQQGPQSGYKFGGVVQGPESGFAETLHGTEAVVPMPNGTGIPVKTPAYMHMVESQISVISEQNSRLDDLIGIMKKRNQLSEKILRAYQS
jgi:predicted chitinase